MWITLTSAVGAHGVLRDPMGQWSLDIESITMGLSDFGML